MSSHYIIFFLEASAMHGIAALDSWLTQKDTLLYPDLDGGNFHL